MGTQYKDVVSNVINELLEYVRLAEAAGVQRQNIILDPGIGFGKTVEQNLELVNRLEEIRALGFPILLGPSRKSFIGKVLDLPAEDRLEGTAAAAAIGISRGADILRVHDVAAITRVARLTDALVRKK
jgi:dihydropteroate synthase